MPLSTQLLTYLTGGVGNTDPALSLGGVTSSTQAAETLHSLFAYITPEEAAAGSVKYRAIAVKNTGTDTLFGAVYYISAETTSISTIIAIGYDATGTQSIANENTAPVGIAFTTPYSKATGVSLGDMAAGIEKRIFVRRTVTTGAVKLAVDLGASTLIGGTSI